MSVGQARPSVDGHSPQGGEEKCVSKTSFLLPLNLIFLLHPLLTRDPLIDIGFKDVERDGAAAEDDIVKGTYVERLAECFFGACSEFAYFEFACFVSERLSGPGDVSVDFGSDVMESEGGISHHIVYRLLS